MNYAQEIHALLKKAEFEPVPARALGMVEDAKKLLEKLYYEKWLQYHQSGTGVREK